MLNQILVLLRSYTVNQVYCRASQSLIKTRIVVNALKFEHQLPAKKAKTSITDTDQTASKEAFPYLKSSIVAV